MSENDGDEGIITPNRRDLLLVVGSASIAGCMGGEEGGSIEPEEDTVVIETTEETKTEKRGVSEDVDGDGEEPSSEVDDEGEGREETTERESEQETESRQKETEDRVDDKDEQTENDKDSDEETKEVEKEEGKSEQTEDDGKDVDSEDEQTENDEEAEKNGKENEKEKDESEQTEDDGKDVDSEDEQTENDEETEKNGEENEKEEEDESEREEVTVEQIVSAHQAALTGSSYSIKAEIQGEESPEHIIKTIEYVKEITGTNKRVAITESSTAENSVKYLTQEFTDDDQIAEVEFEDGERVRGSIDEGFDEDRYPINITGSEIVKQLLGGATLTATYLPEDESGTTGEFEITEHTQLNIDSGEIVINEENMIEEFRLVWDDPERIERDVDVSIEKV